jgi:hypothetical protein
MNSPEPKVEVWRLKLGAGLFGLSILLPAAGVPLVAWFDVSTSVTATVTGGLLVAAEVMGLAAVGVMGKSGYARIKKKVLGFIKKYGPPNKVSRLRYRIGLVMFCTPIAFGWLSIYSARWIPGFGNSPFFYAVGGDLMLLASLFVLGGAGLTANEIGDFGEDSAKWAGGCGFRYLIARRLGLRVGLDPAVGPEDTVLYMGIGSAWR